MHVLEHELPDHSNWESSWNTPEKIQSLQCDGDGGAGDGGDAGGCWGSPKRENGARESRKESETNLTRVRRWTWIDLWEKTFIFEINQEINK